MNSTIKNDNIAKSLFHYVSFSILSMLGLSFYILADTFFIANGVGNTGLTALNLVIPVYTLINAIGLMLGMGGATRYSISIGEGKKEKGHEIFSSIIILGALIGGVFTLLGIIFSGNIVRILGADEIIYTYAKTYLVTIVSFAVPFIVNTIVVCFVRNDGNPNLSMTAMIVGSLSNVVLDYVFIYPLNLGMFGAAFATGLSPIISLCILSTHFIKKKNNFTFIRTRLSTQTLIKGILLGIPSFINEISVAIIMILFNFRILGLVGNTGVAAYGIIANVAIVGVSIFTGIGQGIQPLLSVNYGSKNMDNVKKIYRTGSILGILVGLLLYTIMTLFPREIANLFATGNQELIDITVSGIRIYFLAFIIMGFNMITCTYFAATSYSKESFLISILRGLIFIVPFIFILPILFGINGVWLTITCSELLTLFVSIYYIKRKSTH